MTNHDNTIILEMLYNNDIIKNDGTINSNVNNILKKDTNLKQIILKSTDFLDDVYENLKLSVRIKIIQNNITSLPICEHPECDNPVIINRNRISRHCSSACARKNPAVIKKYNTTCTTKYGTAAPTQSEIVKQKSKKTCQEKYGTNSPLASLDIQEKIKQTNLERYGSVCPLESSIVREKIKQTNLERYGVKNALSNSEIHDKTKKTLFKNHGVEYPLQSPKIMSNKSATCKKQYSVNHWCESQISNTARSYLNNKDWIYEQHITLGKPLTLIAKDLNVYYGTVANYLHRHGLETSRTNISQPELEIGKFISDLGINFLSNSRKIISPHEVDIYIPAHNLAIEFNGNYWHSELAGRDKNYHLNKTNMCAEKGIQLIHIFESEWLLKQDIIKSKILNLLGKNQRIFARKCKVISVSPTTKKQFLDDNHIQGNIGSNINIGLLYEGNLVALMTFGKARFSKQYQYELLRFVTKMKISVVGGASKLFKAFMRDYTPQSVVSYGDLRYGTGALYSNLGFTFVHNSTPNFFYFHKSNAMQLYSRIKFQKHKLEKILENFNPEQSAWQNMVNNGYNRIWDCGNSVWAWTRG